MKLIRLCFVIGLLISLSDTFAQCDIQSKLYADGTMYYYTSPLTFYKEGDKILQGSVITDNENYFITIAPHPFPPRHEGMKLKHNLRMMLTNHKEYTLKFYDASYAAGDTLFRITFKIEKHSLDDFLKYDAEQVVVNMGKDGERRYQVHANKGAIKDQLACLKNRVR